jgi:hypothetical protein
MSYAYGTRVTKTTDGAINKNETQCFNLSSKEANHDLMTIGHPFA